MGKGKVKQKQQDTCYHQQRRPVTTWILAKDFVILQRMAELNNVSMATYLRAIVVDALQDDDTRVKTVELL